MEARKTEGLYVIRVAFSPRELRTAQQKGARIIRLKSGKQAIQWFTKSDIEKSNKRFLDAFLDGAGKAQIPVRTAFSVVRGKLVKERRAVLLYRRSTPLCVDISYNYGMPSALTKAEKAQFIQSYRTKTPDLDNLTKTVIDRITDSGLWEDDAQIVRLSMAKFHSKDDPFIEIRISKLDDPLCFHPKC